MVKLDESNEDPRERRELEDKPEATEQICSSVDGFTALQPCYQSVKRCSEGCSLQELVLIRGYELIIDEQACWD